MRRGSDPQQWIAMRGEPMPFEAELRVNWNRKEARKGQAYLHASALFATAILAWFVCDAAARSTPDYLVQISPFLPVVCLIGGLASAAIGLAISRDFRSALMRRVAKFGWVGMLAVIPLFFALFAISYRSAPLVEPVRAQVTGHESHGRSPFRSTSTILAFEDGATVTVRGSAGHRHACLLVRKVDGPFGFQWLRIEDRSPSPGRGQLNWPVPREACFSDRSLATLLG